MRVYPVPGLPLRDPAKGDFISDQGRPVEDSPYWRRRLKCGDASLTPPKTTPTSPQAAAAAVIESPLPSEPVPLAEPAETAADDAGETQPDGDDA